MKAKTGLKLTEVERLKLDNCMLRRQVIQEEANKRATVVDNDRDVVMKEIGARLKIPMQAYLINLDDGSVTPVNDKPETTEEPAKDTDVDDAALNPGGSE